MIPTRQKDRYSGCVEREDIDASHDRRKRTRHPDSHAGDADQIEEWKDNVGGDERRQCDVRRNGEWKADHRRTECVHRQISKRFLLLSLLFFQGLSNEECRHAMRCSMAVVGASEQQSSSLAAYIVVVMS